MSGNRKDLAAIAFNACKRIPKPAEPGMVIWVFVQDASGSVGCAENGPATAAQLRDLEYAVRGLADQRAQKGK